MPWNSCHGFAQLSLKLLHLVGVFLFMVLKRGRRAENPPPPRCYSGSRFLGLCVFSELAGLESGGLGENLENPKAPKPPGGMGA